MGIYDRDYYREQPKGLFLGGPQTMVVRLIIVNVVVYLVDWLFFRFKLADYLAMEVGTLSHPLHWYRLVTYGFLHDSTGVGHIVFNMLTLWIFGQEIETIYGKKEFLLFYLTALVVAALGWALPERLMDAPRTASCIGASGGIYAVMALFALHYPKRIILFMMFLPMPALLAVALMMAAGFFVGPSNVAHSAHLAGGLFGALYYLSGRRISGLLPSGQFLSGLLRKHRGPKPPLRIHEPQDADADLDGKVDRILEKIHRQGEASLTPDERRTLEDASRRAQKRRQ